MTATPRTAATRPGRARERTALLAACVVGWAGLASAQEAAATQPALTCDGHPSATPLHAVQGPAGARRPPLVGETVTIDAIVVGIFDGPRDDDPFAGDAGGFFVQAPQSAWDDDPTTSEGVLIRAVSPGAIGDRVLVTGTIREVRGQTELSRPSAMLACGPAPEPASPVDVLLPLDAAHGLAAFEGMWVRFPQALTLTEYYAFDRYGEVVLTLPFDGEPLPLQATEVIDPRDVDAIEAREAALEARRIILDDGRDVENPTPPRHPAGGAFTLDRTFRGGDQVVGVQGIVTFAVGGYRIQPTGPAADFVTVPRPQEPPQVGGTVRLATLNVLNYFTSIVGCGPDGRQSCRGADDEEELRRQRAKIVAALAAMDAHVYGLIEIQNDAGDAALLDLVDGLGDALGIDTFRAVRTGIVGTDAITQAILYRSDVVTPVGDAVVLDGPSFVDPSDVGMPQNRPVVAQGFVHGPSGTAFTVAVIHLKSKGSACGRNDDDRIQGNCNGTRTAAASALVDWLAGDPAGTGSPHTVILGDVNAYTLEDPVAAILAGPDDRPGTGDDFVDVVAVHAQGRGSTYLFDGRFGRLDHAFVSSSLAPFVTGAAPWWINAHEPDLIDYDTTFKRDAEDALYAPDPFRSSDHDPVIVGIDIGAR